MPSKTRALLAITIGLLAGAAVWAWPVGPLWHAGPDVGRLDGFSADGRIVVTTRTPYRQNPEVFRWDAATGSLLSRVEMAYADSKSLKLAWPSRDGSMVLVGEGKDLDLIGPRFQSGTWFLHDGMSGKRLPGPIAGVAMVGPGAFSPDGRWFVGRRGDPDGGFKSLGWVDVFSAETGELILHQPDKDGLRASACMFDPSGATALVFWDREGGADHRWQTLQIVELPSGKERRVIRVPWRTMLRAERWDGRFLEMIAREPDKPVGAGQWWTCFYDLAQEQVGESVEDPVLRTRVDDVSKRINWISGPDWLIYFNFESQPEKRTGIGGWFDWLATRVVNDQDRRSQFVQVMIADRTSGAIRYRLPRLVSLSLMPSADGRLLACGADAIEVWSTSPPVRWPNALAAGAAAAGLIVIVRRYKRVKSV